MRTFEVPTILRAHHGKAIQMGNLASLRFLEIDDVATRVLLIDARFAWG